MFLLLNFFFSSGQNIAVTDKPYEGDIGHKGGNLGIGTLQPRKNLEIFSQRPTLRLNYNFKQYPILWDIENNTNLIFSYTLDSSYGSEPNIKMILTPQNQLILGDTIAENSAILQLSSTDKGILIPRLDIGEIEAIKTPAEGLTVFSIDEGVFKYFFKGDWRTIPDDKILSKYMTKEEFYNTVAGGITSEDTARWNEAYRNIAENNTAIWNEANSYVFLKNNEANVGIGTENPANKLHLKTPDKAEVGLRLESKTINYDETDTIVGDETSLIVPEPAVYSYWDIKKEGKNLKFYYNNEQNPVLKIVPDNTSKIIFNGNVGIGTDYPQTRLHIKDGSLLIDGQAPYWTDAHWRKRLVLPLGSAWVSSNNVYGTDYKLGFGLTNTGWYFIEGKDNGDLRYVAKLDLDGIFYANEVRVTVSNWHDEVFDDNYNLLPLDSLENFVIQNKHLPEIPSEDEIKTDSLALGQMQALQMKKIEELTLYIIEQNKKIKQLEKELEKLKKEKNNENEK